MKSSSNFLSVSWTALGLLVLGISTNLLLNTEARRHVPNQYHPVAPNSWTNARAKVRRGPPDAIGNKQVNDDVHGNNGRNERAMPTNIKAKQQQASNSTDSICALPSDKGRGIGMLERYFYNSTSGRCEVFYYGGCSGNENKFMSIEECNQRCNPLGCPPYCSVEYCSDKPTRTALCTIKNPQDQANSCNADCRITNCKICYYADDYRSLDSLPGNCTTCDTYPASVGEGDRQCFKRWSTCVRRANFAEYGNPTSRERIQEKFKCYEHPC